MNKRYLKEEFFKKSESFLQPSESSKKTKKITFVTERPTDQPMNKVTFSCRDALHKKNKEREKSRKGMINRRREEGKGQEPNNGTLLELKREEETVKKETEK